MTRVYVSDTNIWIDFRHADLLNELFALPFTLCSTDFAVDEFHDKNRAALEALGLIVEATEEAAIADLIALMSTHNNSSLADVSCYLLARTHGHALLTGDGRLRRQAEQDGLTVHGALWLLDSLVEYGIVEPARAAAGLQAMLDNRARLPHAECQVRLHRWKP